MRKEVFQTYEFLKYQLLAKSVKTIHPPFAYELVSYLNNNSVAFPDKKTIFSIKNKAANNNNVIEHTDLGAPATGRGYVRSFKKVSDIASKTSIRHKYGKLLYLLVKYFEPNNIIELGTSLGISTLYLSLPNKNTHVISLEGCSETAHVAENYLRKANATNAEVFIGSFESVLSQALKKATPLDMVFFDGHHKYDPTLTYFRQCKEQINEDTMFIFDDIHWSKGMKKAWKAIKRDHDVTLTLDFFQVGVVFFKKGLSKQNLIIRY